ncbi:MAG: hypothetical protein PHV59_12930, partial [Victivallales bacterium]|nr:hypothetical protein [Victivallales bacterium]
MSASGISLGVLAVYLAMPLGDFQKSCNMADQDIAKLKKSITAMAVAGAATVIDFGNSCVKKFEESEAAAKQLEQTLKSTNYAAGFKTDDLKKFSNELKNVSVFGGTALTKAMAVMLTFTNVKGDIFKKAIESAMDLNSALGGDLQGNIIQLGKALNNPITGMTALRRVGVSFSKDQEAQVEALVKAGKLQEAQMIILTELQTEFGGQARAMADTVEGARMKMENSFGGVKRKIGEMIVEGLSLVDMMKNASSMASGLTSSLNGIDDATRNAIVRITALVAVVTTLVTSYKLAAYFGLLPNILGLAKYALLCATSTAASAAFSGQIIKQTAELAALTSQIAAASVAQTPFLVGMSTLPALTFASASAMNALGSAALVVGVAFAGWHFGKAISEMTGLDKVLEDFYAKWIFGIDEIKKRDASLDAKIKALPKLGTRAAVEQKKSEEVSVDPDISKAQKELNEMVANSEAKTL